MNIPELIRRYKEHKIDDVIDHERFNQYAIVHHSTSIEGSTLDETETRLLLEEGVTPKGKPLEHSLMVKDHYDALKYTLGAADEKTPVTTEFIQSVNARVMKHTGTIYNTIFGQIDGSRGEFRKGNVSAGNSYFINYDKVIPYTTKLAEKISGKLQEKLSVSEQLELSFAAHFDLVTIHTFYHGNGRTSRLLMNFIQHYFKLPLAIVFKEDKADYFKALQKSRDKETTEIFHAFMEDQYMKHLTREVTEYEKLINSSNIQPKNSNKGMSFFF